jgi:hypothetical protein
MKAFSIRQPYLHLILEGLQKVEFRTRKYAYRGPVLLHAPQTIEELDDLTPKQLAAIPDELDTCGFLGIVDIVGCECVCLPDGTIGYDYALANPRRIEPIHAHGKLNLYDVPDSILPDSVLRLGGLTEAE